MCAEIPQKVAAKKGSFKLSKKQFFHTLRKHRKTFAGAKVQQKNDMCKEMPYFFEQKDETRAWRVVISARPYLLCKQGILRNYVRSI